MHCPVCSTSMRPMIYEGVEVHTCDGCGGEFIGASQMAHIAQTREERFPADLSMQLADRKPIFGVPVEELARRLACPSCDTPMTVLNYTGDTGVYVDRCPGCGGLFLDRMELEHVQILIERWEDEAPERLKAIADDLERSRREAAEGASRAFSGSRFAFVNALINRILDAA